MKPSRLDQIVEAALYEGYILYPYRASSNKNRQRFTFGRVYPEAFSQAEKGAEPFVMQTQCLLKLDGTPARLAVSVRFLQPVNRQVGVIKQPIAEWGAGASADFESVPELRVGNKLYQTWQEAIERTVEIPPIEWLSSVGSADLQSAVSPTFNRPGDRKRAGVEYPNSQQIENLRYRRAQIRATQKVVPFIFPALRTLEPVRGEPEGIIGVLAREQAALNGEVELSVEELRRDLVRITLRVVNRSALSEAQMRDKEAVGMRTLASTHTILRVTNGEFISLMDPPTELREQAAGCKNVGAWPVLVGEEGQKDAMLSSPLILYDYPQIAPESPGPLFDGTEIDEILTLRILTMTDEEKLESRQLDEHARKLLERTEGLGQEILLGMHGTLRTGPASVGNQVTARGLSSPQQGTTSPVKTSPSKPTDSAADKNVRAPEAVEFDDFFGPSTKIQEVLVGDARVRAGDRVRIRPKARADVLDMALNGKTALVEAIEQDLERKIHLAVVLEDDPGKDLGLMRQPGHRFFYGVDEVEPVREGQQLGDAHAR